MVLGVVDGCEVEIELSVLGVEDLDVAGDGQCRAVEGNAVDAADFVGDALTEGFGSVQSEEVASGSVEEHDFSPGIQDNEAFLQRFENVLQEALFLDQAGDDLLDLSRLNTVEARHEFFKETGFHGREDGCGGWEFQSLIGVSQRLRMTHGPANARKD